MTKENTENDKKPRQPKRLPKYIPLEELKILLNAPYKTNTHHKIMMKLGAVCGLRGSEVLKVKKEDIKLDEMEIRVNLGKGKVDRIVPIPSLEFIKELREYIEDLNPQDNLFEMETTEGLTSMVKRYAKYVGIERNITFHMLRHSFAVHSLKSGVNLRSLQKALGHKQLTSTQIYLDLLSEDMKDDYRDHLLPY